jgi:hypothetical protein
MVKERFTIEAFVCFVIGLADYKKPARNQVSAKTVEHEELNDGVNLNSDD